MPQLSGVQPMLIDDVSGALATLRGVCARHALLLRRGRLPGVILAGLAVQVFVGKAVSLFGSRALETPCRQVERGS
jgi:hypothetical protein